MNSRLGEKVLARLQHLYAASSGKQPVFCHPTPLASCAAEFFAQKLTMACNLHGSTNSNSSPEAVA